MSIHDKLIILFTENFLRKNWAVKDTCTFIDHNGTGPCIVFRTALPGNL